MTEQEVNESLEWFRKRYGWPREPDSSMIPALTAEELAQAILATHSMIQSTGPAEAAHSLYVAHLKDLLEVQRLRAGIIG